MTTVAIAVGSLRFVGRLEEEAAPRTCAAVTDLLPIRNKLVQARWSGESAWIPLGNLSLGLPLENATSYPAPGEVLFYPGGYGETEILIPYGATRFDSKWGQLAGNHFLTIVEGRELLPDLGLLVLYGGAQEILVRAQGLTPSLEAHIHAPGWGKPRLEYYEPTDLPK